MCAGEHELVVAGGAGDHARTHDPAQFDRGEPDPARGAEHGQGLAGTHQGPVCERVIGGAVGDGQRCGALEVEIGGDFDDLAGRNGRAFARRVEIGVAHDAVAGLELGNPRAYAFDHTGELATGRERKRRFGLVFAGDDQGVEEIQADRRDLGHDLARSGHRLRDIREHEVIGRAETLTENGFHGWAARTVSGRRYSMDGVERRRRGWLPRIGYVYSGSAASDGRIRLHIAEFPKLMLAVRGLFFNSVAAVTEVGR